MDLSEIVEEHLFLAEVIAFDYANIPGCRLDEAKSEATMGLIRAAEAYNPAKGEFTPFASKAIRNALNTLYAKQLRMLKMFPKSLDEAIPRYRPQTTPTTSDAGDLLSNTTGRHDIGKEIRQNEAAAALESVMNLLTPRERIAVEALRIGKSYPEIGEALGITKQAAHKSARSGLAKLRVGLERLGYQGIASDGLLASRRNKNDQAPG
jgi:RNA polymerase sigma factor (sigma-70 family)